MKETITIENFGGIKKAVIPLNSINIFIGKQASGKSVTAKLIYFFRKVFEDIFDGLIEDKKQKDIDKEISLRFKKYFSVDSWSKGRFSIQYDPGEYLINRDEGQGHVRLENILIERKGKDDISINYSALFDLLSNILDYLKSQLDVDSSKNILQTFNNRQKDFFKFYYHGFGLTLIPFGLQTFVPAGRSFFSNIQSSIFSILATGNSIDPFLVEFGSTYERYKNYKLELIQDKSPKYVQDSLQNSLSDILDGKFLSDNTGDYLVHKDGRKINLLFCSSGQQEALPLALILKNYVGIINFLQMFSNTLYIEEPEAHLFPSAQKKIVEMIATAHNLAKGKSQLIITTHSPYILTSFNNLLQAGQLLDKGMSKRKLFKIVPEFEILKPGELNAFAFQDGGVTSLIDEETGLISADLLDKVSEEIAVQFDELLEL